MSDPDVPEWHGYVTDIAGDIFTAVLCREGEPDITADFSMSECGLAGAEPGAYLVVTPGSVRRLEMPPWTQEQIDEIRREAERRLAQLLPLIDLGRMSAAVRSVTLWRAFLLPARRHSRHSPQMRELTHCSLNSPRQVPAR